MAAPEHSAKFVRLFCVSMAVFQVELVLLDEDAVIGKELCDNELNAKDFDSESEGLEPEADKPFGEASCHEFVIVMLLPQSLVQPGFVLLYVASDLDAFSIYGLNVARLMTQLSKPQKPHRRPGRCMLAKDPVESLLGFLGLS